MSSCLLQSLRALVAGQARLAPPFCSFHRLQERAEQELAWAHPSLPPPTLDSPVCTQDCWCTDALQIVAVR